MMGCASLGSFFNKNFVFIAAPAVGRGIVEFDSENRNVYNSRHVPREIHHGRMAYPL